MIPSVKEALDLFDLAFNNQFLLIEEASIHLEIAMEREFYNRPHVIAKLKQDLASAKLRDSNLGSLHSYYDHML